MVSSTSQPATNLHTHVKCHECDTVVSIPILKHGESALCPNCGYQLSAHRDHAEHFILAFSITAFMFLLLAIPYKFMSFEASGQVQSVDIPQAVIVLIENNYLALAIITLFAIVLLPALVLGGLIYLLVPRLFGKTAPFSRSALNMVYYLLPWSMAEIFLISVLVSLVKIKSMAEVQLGMSFYAYVLFTLAFAATIYYMDRFKLYTSLTQGPPPHPISSRQASPTYSIQQTWALLFTACLLYIPANVLPIMTTRWLGKDEPSTILGGVKILWEMGSYPIALVILIASVVVPVAKLVTLAWLNYSVQAGHNKNHSQRIRLYRVTELVGRWSMVDVFVVAILVALVQLGNTMSIYPGPAALAFCAVVFITMLAAMTFDSRLIWQNRDSINE